MECLRCFWQVLSLKQLLYSSVPGDQACPHGTVSLTVMLGMQDQRGCQSSSLMAAAASGP